LVRFRSRGTFARVRRWMGLVAGALTYVGATCPARAGDKEACIDANVRGQELRLNGRWHQAELRFKECSRNVCPDVIAQDCVHRYDELQALMPTLLVAAKSPEGADTVDARLLVDGVVVASSLPATAIAVDPGEHAVSVERDGWTTPDQNVVVLEREKDRRIQFLFAPARPMPVHRGLNVLGIGLTAGGAVVTGVGVMFIALGLAQRSALLGEPCAATLTCSPDDVSAVTRDYVIGGLATGVGLAILGVGIWELLSPQTSSAVGVSPGGLRFVF
jgi:hypothetical protein